MKLYFKGANFPSQSKSHFSDIFEVPGNAFNCFSVKVVLLQIAKFSTVPFLKRKDDASDDVQIRREQWDFSGVPGMNNARPGRGTHWTQ